MTSDPASSTAATTNPADAIVGIVVALPEELSTLTRRKIAPGECAQMGSLWLAYAGAGCQNATNAAQALLNKGANRLLSWGCAAGLSAEAKPGDLLIPSQVVTADHRYDTDESWRRQVIQALGTALAIHSGPLFTSANLIGASQDKQTIHQRSQAAALDMESAAIAEVAIQARVPFLAIRTVADPVSMDLPQAVQQALNPHGQVELSRLLRYLCGHPWEVTGLIQLGLHFHAAQKTLKIVARQLWGSTLDQS